MGRVDGKVAIITGAGAGIGEAGALLFAQEGARVVVVDARADAGQRTADAIVAAGGDAISIPTDVTKLDQVQAMVDEVIDRHGRIDILWNNAGIVRGVFTPLEEIPIEQWQQVIDVNLNGVFHGLKCVIPHMKAQRYGRIVSTASIAGLVANVPGRAPYTAAKGAVISLTRLLALELAGHNIRVNCIAPGRVRTPMTSALQAPEENAFGTEWAHPDPLPVTDATRIAEPIELAHTALYLVGDEAGPLTGVTIAHDGGRTTR